MIMARFGFCCKWLNDPNETGGMKVNAIDRDINGRSTTMRWLREHKEEADQRQWDIMNHNARAALLMVERVVNAIAVVFAAKDFLRQITLIQPIIRPYDI